MPVCSIWEFPTPGLDISSEETIQFNLEKARCPKDKNALYNDVKVKLESQGILAYNVILQFINKELERVPVYTEVFKPFIVREFSYVSSKQALLRCRCQTDLSTVQ